MCVDINTQTHEYKHKHTFIQWMVTKSYLYRSINYVSFKQIPAFQRFSKCLNKSFWFSFLTMVNSCVLFAVVKTFHNLKIKILKVIKF